MELVQLALGINFITSSDNAASFSLVLYWWFPMRIPLSWSMVWSFVIYILNRISVLGMAKWFQVICQLQSVGSDAYTLLRKIMRPTTTYQEELPWWLRESVVHVGWEGPYIIVSHSILFELMESKTRCLQWWWSDLPPLSFSWLQRVAEWVWANFTLWVYLIAAGGSSWS